MTINLKNKTHWRDDHIRAFIKRAMQDERPDLCKRGAKPLNVTVVYTRTRCSSGYAYYHSNVIMLRIKKQSLGNDTKRYFMHTIYHELAHTRGVRHVNMHNKAYGWVPGWSEHYAWVDDMPLEVKPKVVKIRPTPDVKLAHCEQMLKAAMTREKRATTIRKKWQAKVKYYTKKQEVLNEQATEPQDAGDLRDHECRLRA